jgi:hypothetical protein
MRFWPLTFLAILAVYGAKRARVSHEDPQCIMKRPRITVKSEEEEESFSPDLEHSGNELLETYLDSQNVFGIDEIEVIASLESRYPILKQINWIERITQVNDVQFTAQCVRSLDPAHFQPEAVLKHLHKFGIFLEDDIRNLFEGVWLLEKQLIVNENLVAIGIHSDLDVFMELLMKQYVAPYYHKQLSMDQELDIRLFFARFKRVIGGQLQVYLRKLFRLVVAQSNKVERIGCEVSYLRLLRFFTTLDVDVSQFLGMTVAQHQQRSILEDVDYDEMEVIAGTWGIDMAWVRYNLLKHRSYWRVSYDLRSRIFGLGCHEPVNVLPRELFRPSPTPILPVLPSESDENQVTHAVDWIESSAENIPPSFNCLLDIVKTEMQSYLSDVVPFTQ